MQHDIHPSVFGRVAVMYGGCSEEREISLQSGQAVLSALQASGVDAFGIDLAENMLEQIESAAMDRAFLALHGVGGEDGHIQALLDDLNIPYTGSGVAASSLAMDKLKSKQIWVGTGMSTAPFTELNEQTDWQTCIEALGGKAMIKPVREGSSIGMSSASNAAELKQAWQMAAKLDPVVMAEQWLSGREFTVPILGDQCLPSIELKPNAEFYTYDAKYLASDTGYLCPAPVSEDIQQQLNEMSLAAFESLGCQGWGRVDLMADEQGVLYLLEVNTIPGMTSHSLVPMAARAAGMSFEELVLAILAQTLEKEGGLC